MAAAAEAAAQVGGESVHVDTRVLHQHCVTLLQIIVLHLKYAHILYIVLHGRQIQIPTIDEGLDAASGVDPATAAMLSCHNRPNRDTELA